MTRTVPFIQVAGNQRAVAGSGMSSLRQRRTMPVLKQPVRSRPYQVRLGDVVRRSAKPCSAAMRSFRG
jgi:hypothetical protein